MRRLLAGMSIGIVMTAAVLLAIVATAQGPNILSSVRPQVVDVRQSVPIMADVVVPLDNGASVTATVPLTLDIALQIAVSGVVSESVQVARSVPANATGAVVTAPPVSSQSQYIVNQAQDLVYEGLKWTVKSAENAGAAYDDPNDQRGALVTENSFLVVHFSVENLGAVRKEVDYDDDELRITLRDSMGRRFDGEDHPSSCDGNEINPGLTKTCSIIFEVPQNVAGFSMVFATENGYEQVVQLGF